MDVGKSTFLSGEKYAFMQDNKDAIRTSVRPPGVRDVDWGLAKTKKHYRRIVRYHCERSKHGISRGGFVEFEQRLADENLDMDKLIQIWRGLRPEERAMLNPRRLPDTVDATFHPANTLGALPEKLLDSIHSYISKNGPDPEFESTLFWKGVLSLPCSNPIYA